MMSLLKPLLVLVLANVVLSNQLLVKNVVHDALTEIIDEIMKLNTTCARQVVFALDENNLKDGWPLKMLDASSKIPSGLMSGNIADLGAFDQCLSIEVKFENDILKGKYCKAAISLDKIKEIAGALKQKNNLQPKGIISIASGNPSLSLAICLPSACSAEEINKFLQMSSITKNFGLQMTNCQSTDREPFNAGDWAVLIFLIIMVVLIISSTGYDIYIQSREEKPAHLILIAFSWYTHGTKLLTVTNNPNQLPCLHGMRFISMMWVIIGHTYYTAFFSPSINALETFQWMKNYSSMYILGATVSVDTFFVLGGLLMSYVYLSAKDKGHKFNVIVYYVHRYIRLTPALAVAILLHVTLLRFIGSGPYWPEVMKYLEINCSKYWWSSLLYVQNYVNAKEMCMGQTWYLSVDFQLFLLSPLALIPLGHWPKITIPVLGFLIVVSMVIPFTIAYIYDISGLMTNSITNPDYAFMYYQNTYARFGPIIVGIVLGYYVYNRKQNIQINSLFKNIIFKAAGWIISLGSLFLIVFEANNMYYHEYDKIESSIYIGVHRVAWSIALSWIVYACIIGQGGILNSFLSLPIFQILSRLTYSMYLIHLSFQTLRIGLLRAPIHFGNFEGMYNFWGDFCITAILGVFWTLAFESPMITIEKIIFGGGKQIPEEKPLNKITAQS